MHLHSNKMMKSEGACAPSGPPSQNDAYVYEYVNALTDCAPLTHTTLTHLCPPTPHTHTYIHTYIHVCTDIHVGEPFPWRRLGYPNMISLLQAMPEAVHFDYSQKDSDYLLHGVGDKNSFFMPSWQRKTQGVSSMDINQCTPLINTL